MSNNDENWLELFVLDSLINALSDSYPVTWLTKVVALLPPAADSLALYGLCGLALPSIYATKLPGFNGHVTIWDGISGRGRECTGRMKVVFVESSWWLRPRGVYLLLESFSETFLSFGVLLHSRFGSHAASIEQWPSGVHWIVQQSVL
jgi:hypothetical protein